MGDARPPRAARPPSPASRPTRSARASRARGSASGSGSCSTRSSLKGLEQGRVQLNGARARVGLPPLDYLHGGISRELAIVGDVPAARVPAARLAPVGARDRAADVGAAVPRRRAAAGRRPARADRAVDRAGPRAADARARRSRGSPTSRCACSRPTTGGRRRGRSTCPPNARLVEWVSYARTMPLCDAVVCHAGHGTLVRALASGVPVVACPAAGDMAENAARVAWAGAGVSLPRRLVTAARRAAGRAAAAGRPGVRAARARVARVVAS